MKTLLLVDDHGLVRHGLQLLLQEAMPGLKVLAAGSLQQALGLLDGSARLDLVLLDLSLGDVHGMAGLKQLRAAHPQVPVVILSAQDDRDTVLRALDHGAMGFVSKSAAPAELRLALTRVLVDRVVHLPQSVSEAGADGIRGLKSLSQLSALGLTERQIEVLGYVVLGWSNKEIARKLDRSEVLVKKHVTAALQALGVPNRTKALVALSCHGYQIPMTGSPATGRAVEG